MTRWQLAPNVYAIKDLSGSHCCCQHESLLPQWLSHTFQSLNMCPINFLKEQQLTPGVSLGKDIFLAHLWNCIFSKNPLYCLNSKKVHLPINNAICYEFKISLVNICSNSPVSLRAHLCNLGQIFQPAFSLLFIDSFKKFNLFSH